jgi:hypothetical protein
MDQFIRLISMEACVFDVKTLEREKTLTIWQTLVLLGNDQLWFTLLQDQ